MATESGDDGFDPVAVDHLDALGADPQPDAAILRGQVIGLELDVGVPTPVIATV
jgi:hypothetical protein